MHARQIGPLNLGAKPYVRQKSQIIFVGAGYRVLLAALTRTRGRLTGRVARWLPQPPRQAGSDPNGVSAALGWRSDEEPTGKTCGLPRFHIIHRPNLLSGQGKRARCQDDRAKPELVQINTAYGVQQEAAPSCLATNTRRFETTARSRRTTPSAPSSRSASTPPRPSSPRVVTWAPFRRYVRI